MGGGGDPTPSLDVHLGEPCNAKIFLRTLKLVLLTCKVSWKRKDFIYILERQCMLSSSSARISSPDKPRLNKGNIYYKIFFSSELWRTGNCHKDLDFVFFLSVFVFSFVLFIKTSETRWVIKLINTGLRTQINPMSKNLVFFWFLIQLFPSIWVMKTSKKRWVHNTVYWFQPASYS